MSVSRRDALHVLTGLAAAACTSSAPPVPQEPPPPPPPPRELLADGPSPEVLLHSEHGGDFTTINLTIYGDGLATYYRHESMKNRGRRPEVQLARLPVADLTALRNLVEGPDFLGAGSHLYEPRVRHGLHMLVGGPRRIALKGEPKDLPPGVAEILRRVAAIEADVETHGQDAFTSSEPQVLTIHDRWFRARRFADQLTVFANGVLDYRVTHDDVPFVAGKDFATPNIRALQVPPGELAELRALLAGGPFVPAQSIDHVLGDGAPAGTTHFVMHRGPIRIEVAPGFQAPAGVRPVLAALAKLIARFAGPPDEPGVAPAR